MTEELWSTYCVYFITTTLLVNIFSFPIALRPDLRFISLPVQWIK